ncbi:shikimate dehydrogenase [Halodurantibacterium flavum]|uniref:Shikimate dehydrogenase (NADP(+)) n=1 Tax=Halodurantibacterium flavum TaxID=1382802 RepID=A0ABW4S8U7_9RHOB
MTTETIRLAAVIGSPIAHSRSPALHRHWLETYGIKGFYVPLEVSQADLRDALRTLPRMGFVGANVTIPHKETVLQLADVVTDRAALIGAANALIFRPDGKIHADNTDGYGFIANLRQHVPDWQPQAGPVALFGAGGAARAVISSLLEGGAPEIRIANRTRARAEAMRAEFGAKVVVHDWVQAADMLNGAATIVNSTALGMTGKPDLRLPYDAFSPNAVVTDLVYSPLRTAFLEEAAARGCRTVDGLGMLLHQGAPCFERWFGVRPEVDEATRAAVLK